MLKYILLFAQIIILTHGTSNKLISSEIITESLAPQASFQGTTNDMVTPLVSPATEAIEAYKRVLNNDIEFFSTYFKRDIYLQDYCIEDCTVDDFEKYFSFAVVDMDANNIPEVVLYIGPPGINLIFHYENGIVYGHSFGSVETKDIRINGLFELRNKVVWILSRLEFSEGAYNRINLAEVDSNNEFRKTYFYLNDIEVTEKEFRDFIDNSYYWENELADWYNFDKENLDTYLIWNE